MSVVKLTEAEKEIVLKAAEYLAEQQARRNNYLEGMCAALATVDYYDEYYGIKAKLRGFCDNPITAFWVGDFSDMDQTTRILTLLMFLEVSNG